MNPFKFGTIVENDFFTDRKEELEEVKQKLDSENHLVLISPRRFGKSSLVNKALKQIGRPSITIDFMKVLSVSDLASHIMRGVFRLYKMEKVKHYLLQFRVVPTVSYNPLTDSWDVAFQPSASQTPIILEDAMGLLEKVSTQEKRLIVVFDEFQEVNDIDKNLAKQLRAIMQRQKGLNYIFLGSQESMMNDIFEKKKSPFYHFGQRMNLSKVPYDDFFKYIVDRLPDIPEDSGNIKETIANEILTFTNIHPYYTQQLSSEVYNSIIYNNVYEDVVEISIKKLVQEHDLDYERLWLTMNRMDRRVILALSENKSPIENRQIAQTTIYSAIKRLQKMGYIIKTSKYELEDPFFGRWVSQHQ